MLVFFVGFLNLDSASKFWSSHELYLFEDVEGGTNDALFQSNS